MRVEFDAGAQGAFIRWFPEYFGAVPELVEAWRQAGLTGFTTHHMISVPSRPASALDPTYEPPQDLEVQIAGGPTDDLHTVDGEVEVRVSKEAARIYDRLGPGDGGLFVGTENDVLGDSLSPDEIAAALNFKTV